MADRNIPDELRLRLEQRARDCGIPAYMVGGLMRYLFDRIPAGSFLDNVLSNDLMGALKCADDTNVNCLRAYGMFLYNYAPMGSYGSPAKVAAWLNPVAQQEEDDAA